MVTRGWTASWWTSVAGGTCAVCLQAIEMLGASQQACARTFALDLLTGTDPRRQALRAMEVLASCAMAEVSVLAPEGADAWLVLASSNSRLRNDLLLPGERHPALAALRREGLPVLPPMPGRGGASGSAGRTCAALPFFRHLVTAEPVVLLVDCQGTPDREHLALAVLVAHLLLHRLNGSDPAEVAARLGLRPLPQGVGGPGWLQLLPLPALLVDAEDHLVAANSAGSWLLQRGESSSSRDPGPVVMHPGRPWVGTTGHWVASLQVQSGQVEVRGWSRAVPAGGFVVILERVGAEEPGARSSAFRASLQEKITELEAANRRLEDLARLRTRFVSDAAHELKTPLAILRSYLEALGTDLVTGLDSQQREFLGAATEGARRLQRLVEELLDLAALESGSLPLVVGPVDAPSVLRTAFEELSPLARLGEVELRLGPVEALTVRADPARLGQVLRNLVDNALKYTRRGGQVRLGCRRRCDTGVIEVSDNGVGIPPDELPRIFEEFYRVPHTPIGEGAGLGLAIVRRLVQAMGGRIDAVSEPAMGSRFSVELPVWTGA
ncbi:MAG TPA: HAMP domain-containing sensor histidine kinase [Thermoanaerobaculaceae bacterium]|nr:HAMP domain-containing sensor histidine kinase [Thermoanaerobaculaceae bacterium]